MKILFLSLILSLFTSCTSTDLWYADNLHYNCDDTFGLGFFLRRFERYSVKKIAHNLGYDKCKAYYLIINDDPKNKVYINDCTWPENRRFMVANSKALCESNINSLNDYEIKKQLKNKTNADLWVPGMLTYEDISEMSLEALKIKIKYMHAKDLKVLSSIVRKNSKKYFLINQMIEKKVLSSF